MQHHVLLNDLTFKPYARNAPGYHQQPKQSIGYQDTERCPNKRHWSDVSNWRTILKLLAPAADRRANSLLRGVPLANNKIETLLQPIIRSIASAANSKYRMPPMFCLVL